MDQRNNKIHKNWYSSNFDETTVTVESMCILVILVFFLNFTYLSISTYEFVYFNLIFTGQDIQIIGKFEIKKENILQNSKER